MTTITVTIPDLLHTKVDQLIKQEGMSWDQFVALAVTEKTSAIATEGYLEERARPGSKEKFLAAIAKVADVEPPDERDRWNSPEPHPAARMLAEQREGYQIEVALGENNTMMQAVEFQATVRDGMIEIPKKFRQGLTQQVRVIVLAEERPSQSFNLIDELIQNPLTIEGFKPLTREEIYARR